MPQMELFQCIVREKFYPLPDEITDDCFYVVDELLEKDPNQRLGSLAGHGKGEHFVIYSYSVQVILSVSLQF